MYSMADRLKNLAKARAASAKALRDNPEAKKAHLAKLYAARDAYHARRRLEKMGEQPVEKPVKKVLTKKQIRALNEGRKIRNSRGKITTFRQRLDKGILTEQKKDVYSFLSGRVSEAQPGNFLTLPGPHCLFEKFVVDKVRNDLFFVGAEQNARRARMAEKNMPKNGKILDMDVHQILKIAERQYSGMWLDMMGEFDEELLRNIPKTLIGPSPVAITMMVTREPKHLVKRMRSIAGFLKGKTLSDGARFRAVRRVIEAAGAEVSPGSYHVYHSMNNGKAVKMMVMAFTVTPKSKKAVA